MDCSIPGFPILCYLLDFAQTHVHWVGEAIQLSHPLSPLSPPILSLSQHQFVFQSFPMSQLFTSAGQSILASAAASVWRRQWHPTPVPLPGKSHGWRSLVGCSPWDCEDSDTTERLHFHFSLSGIGEGNGNPLQCSCLENPRDREPGGLLSMGSHRVRHDWSDLAAAAARPSNEYS